MGATGVDEEKMKDKQSVSPPEKSNSGVSLSPSAKKMPPPPPKRPTPPPKQPKAPSLKTESEKGDVVAQKTDSNALNKEEMSSVGEADKTNDKKLEEEIEIARLQCEDDDNAAGLVNEDEVIEKSYKAGLSDQDKQRKKRKLRRLLIILLLLLLLGGTVSATYFIVKNKLEYVPEFYDNVAIAIDAPPFAEQSNRMPGDEFDLARPIMVLVNADTEEINYDIVALGIKVTAKFTDTGEDCSDIIDVGFCDVDQIYKTDDWEFADDAQTHIRCGKDLMFYYRKVLEPGQSEALINSIRINKQTSNEYAKKQITVNVEVVAVYPNPAQIRDDTSEFKDAPQGWVEEVYEKMTDIFKERAKKRGLFS